MLELIDAIRTEFDLTDKEISVKAGRNAGYIAQLKARGTESEKFTLKLRELLSELRNSNNLNDQKLLHSLPFNGVPVGEPIAEYSNKTNSFFELSGGLYLMKTKLVTKKARAGYLAGWGDDEYLDELPEHAITVAKPVKGLYMSFEVEGDSMDDRTDEAIKNGDIVTGRLIARSHWTNNKLHLHEYEDFIIVSFEGVLVKRIIDHDVKRGIVTYRSLNPDKVSFPDEELEVSKIMQIFNIIDLSRNRKRKF